MKIGRIRLVLTALSFCCIASSGMAAEGGGAALSSPQVQDLQEKILNDQGIMAMVKLLQDDPEIQALLSDPKVLEAAQAGDIGALLQNPRFLRALNNPRVKEVEKRLEDREGGGAK